MKRLGLPILIFGVFVGGTALANAPPPRRPQLPVEDCTVDHHQRNGDVTCRSCEGHDRKERFDTCRVKLQEQGFTRTCRTRTNGPPGEFREVWCKPIPQKNPKKQNNRKQQSSAGPGTMMAGAGGALALLGLFVALGRRRRQER